MNKKMKPKVIFCTGQSGSGKSTFIKKFLTDKQYYNLRSATTRPMRGEEQDGREYYFRDEAYFDNETFATKLFVNEKFWKPGQPKWLYGVPEFEIFDNLGKIFTYDVIQPKYIRQMIDWFYKNGLTEQYGFKILWFQPVYNSESIVKDRQNMQDDEKVRRDNTCNIRDFERAQLKPDFVIKRTLPEGYRIYPYGTPEQSYSLSRLLHEIQR